MIISIHVPKTAGTTVGYLLDYGSKRRILFDYVEDYREFSEKIQYFEHHAPFVREFFDVIHGHFYYRKWQPVFPEARFITTVRHPVARVISQYLHVLNSGEGYFGEAIQSGQVDVVDFAGVDNIGNAQAVFLDGREIDDYDFVFITEELESSFTLYQRRYHFSRMDPLSDATTFPRLNTKESRSKTLTFSDDIKRQIYARTQRDNELYARAMERHKKLLETL